MVFVQPKFWKTVNAIAVLLLPLAYAYRIISRLRYKLQTPIRFSKAKVICIGNSSVGGSGKTPLAIALGKILLDLGTSRRRKVRLSYACKNYGASTMQTCQDYSSANVIDEALLLARVAPTFVAPHRLDAIKAACNATDVVIADDGLQNNSFSKDISILAVPDDKSFGNRLIFPAGPMRESLLDSIKKSDLVFLMNERGASHAHSRRIIEQYFDKAKVFSTLYSYMLCDRDGVIEKSSELCNKKFLAFCGIANPDRFFDALLDEGLGIVERAIYPDHHRYSEQDLCLLAGRAKALNACLITTEKDIVKLSDKWQSLVIHLKLNAHVE
jgi:tetraacyldisaccharide 4'-kinase